MSGDEGLLGAATVSFSDIEATELHATTGNTIRLPSYFLEYQLFHLRMCVCRVENQEHHQQVVQLTVQQHCLVNMNLFNTDREDRNLMQEEHNSIRSARPTAESTTSSMRLPSLFLCLVAVVAGASAATTQSAGEPILFAATWTKETTNGINTFKLNTADGSLTPYGITPLAFAAKGINPTYVQGSNKKFSNGERVIYALNRGSTTGYVSAMTLQSNGTLKVINSQEMKGRSPAYVALSPKEDFISVANYVGSLSLFPLNADGSVGAESFYQDFPVGSKVVMDNQATGHIHSTTWLPNSNHVIVANLGSDELLQYELDTTKKTLKSLQTVNRPPGSGPRHMALHPNGGIAYVTDELSNTVGVYTIDKKAAVLSSKALQNITTLPAGFTNTSAAADIHLSDNGKFVYVSNRGHNSIVTYKINGDGTLKALNWESSRGVTPCGFTIYKDWLIVANRDSNDMYVFKIDAATGALIYTGNSYQIDDAVSLYVAEY